MAFRTASLDVIGFAPTEEQRSLRQAAARLARDVVGPVAAEVRRAGGDPWPCCESVFHAAGDMGLTGILVPAQAGGGGGGCLDLCIALEEVGAVDVAIAANYVNLPATMALMLARAGGRPFAEAVVQGRPRLLAGALNEPDVAGADVMAPVSGPGIGIATRADRDRDGWIISGRKAGFVTNGAIADAYLVVARTDEGPWVFWVPAPAAGLSFGARTELAGWPTARHAEVLLDRVSVPADAAVGPAHQVLGGTPEMAIGLAACFVGLARASYEDAVRYARQRSSWGRPIIEHQAVALKLAGMRQRLDAAQLLVWQAAWAADGGDLRAAAGVLGPSAKAFAVDAAIEVCGRAVEIFGGYGVAGGSVVAARLADAWVGYSCDFTRELLLLSTTSFL